MFNKSSANSSFIIEKEENIQYPFNKSLYPTCPKCLTFPICKFVENEPKKIRIKCLCSNIEIINIEKYLNIININKSKIPKCEKFKEHSNINATEYCTECKLFLCSLCSSNHNEWATDHNLISLNEMNCECNLHDNKNTEFFCFDCKRHICSFCYNKHIRHNFIKVDEICDEYKFKEFEETYNNIKNYLSINLVQIKDNIINNLKYEIKKIEDAFRKNKIINDNILNFIKLLIDDYIKNKKNYFLYKTIDKICKLKLTKINNFDITDTSKNNINSFINYLNTNIIHNVNIIKFQKLKELRHFGDSYNNNQITSLLILKDGRIATGSSDRSIKLYSTYSYKCDMIIDGFNFFKNIYGHSNTISYISQNFNQDLISSSLDSTIKIWNILKNYQHLTTLQGHSSGVIKAIPISNNRIASCSFDKTIRIWQSLPPYNSLYIFNGHTERINSIIQLNNNYQIVSGSSKSDNSIRIWNINDYRDDGIIADCPCCYKNGLLELDNDKLLSGSQKGVSLIDLNNLLLIKLIQFDNIGCIMCLLLNQDDTIIISGDGQFVYQYDLLHQKILAKKDKMHSKCISSIISYSNKGFLTASWDGSIKIWK